MKEGKTLPSPLSYPKTDFDPSRMIKAYGMCLFAISIRAAKAFGPVEDFIAEVDECDKIVMIPMTASLTL